MYRESLELFQIFLKDFKETPRSRLAKKFVVDDPILEEDEDRYSMMSTNNRQTRDAFGLLERNGSVMG